MKVSDLMLFATIECQTPMLGLGHNERKDMLHKVRLSDRDLRDATAMVYRSDSNTQEFLRIQAQYRRELLRRVSDRRGKVKP